MSINILLIIIVTSLATYVSRFLGVVSSIRIKETSKIFNQITKKKGFFFLIKKIFQFKIQSSFKYNP